VDEIGMEEERGEKDGIKVSEKVGRI